MKLAVKKLRPPFKCHGGKYYLCDWVIRNFPDKYEEMTYLELFGGAASVLLNKKRSIKEIYNDLHQPTANIFSCLVQDSINFIQKIHNTDYSEKSFKAAHEVKFKFGTLDSAVAELVLRRMSRGGMKKHFSWSTRTRGGRPGDLNAWETFKSQFPLISDRVQKLEVYSTCAFKLMEDYLEDPMSLMYLDPPYVTGTRTAKAIYDCEISDDDHRELARLANKAAGCVIISGYDSPLYRQLYKKWNWVTKEVANNSGQGKIKQRRIECLIKNY